MKIFSPFPFVVIDEKSEDQNRIFPVNILSV